MKKRIFALIIVFLILLFPVRLSRKDGGTKDYVPVTFIYRVVKYNAQYTDPETNEEGRLRGWEITILGQTVYKDTYFVPDN
jgi:hypothetical protein